MHASTHAKRLICPESSRVSGAMCGRGGSELEAKEGRHGTEESGAARQLVAEGETG